MDPMGTATLPQTNSSPLKINGWNLEHGGIPFGLAYFQWLFYLWLFVSWSVNQKQRIQTVTMTESLFLEVHPVENPV